MEAVDVEIITFSDVEPNNINYTIILEEWTQDELKFRFDF